MSSDTDVAFRPGSNINEQAVALHQHAVEHGWFLTSQGKRTESLMYGFTWDDLIVLLSKPPGVCDHLVRHPQGRSRPGRCGRPKDQLVTVPGGGHATSDDYLVATCSDLHAVMRVEPHHRWKCLRSGYWADGAWHLPSQLISGPVDLDRLE